MSFEDAVRRPLLALLAILCIASTAGAQEIGGTVSGTIKDAQSAVLPGASLTLHNDGTGAELNVATNSEGVYVLPFVPIGRYTLTASLSGFSTVKRTGLEVRVADRLRIDLTLQVGTMTEQVTVAETTPLLDASSASRGQLINQDQIQELPLLGRNPFMLAQLSTGVQYTPALASRSNRPFDNGGMDNLSISGGRAFTNEFLLDGVPNSGTETNQPNNLSFVPSPDATAEFRVQTNIYDAQYGRTGGGVINVVLKSGTNTLHGSAYAYYRDDKLNANTFDANRVGRPREDLYWNQPGLSLNGPVKIPGLYDGANKTFFMFSWERIRSESPFPQIYTVPTALERAGDFSQTRTADGRPVIIYDPLTTRQVGGQYVRDPFPGNVIPAGRIDPVARQLLQRVPMPNAAGVTNNFSAADNSRGDKYDQYVLRLDQTLGSKHRVAVKLARNKRTEFNETAGYPTEASPWYQHGRMNVGVSADVTSVLNPTLVLNSRAGFIRHDFYIQPHGDGFDPATLGFASSFTSQLARDTFPQIQYEGYSTYGTTFGGGTGPIFTVSDTWSWTEAFSKTAGNHALKFGGEFRAMINDQQNPTSSTGRFAFTRAFTQADPLRADATAGNGVASMLLGYPASGFTPVNAALDYKSHYYGVYLQDDWRINPKLTLNLGVRWDYESPITEALDQQNRGFDASAASPLQVPGMQLKGGLLFTDEQTRRPFKRDLNNFQPRFGVTYQWTPRTVVRGGYGISYLPVFDTGQNNGFSLQTTLVASVDGGITPSVRLSNPYPSGIDQPVGRSQGLGTLLGRGFTYSNPDRTIPYVHQFSVGIQRELPGRMVIDLSYAGSRTRGTAVSKGVNEVSAEQLGLGSALLTPVANPFQGQLPGTAYNGATVPRQQLLRPYPQFDALTEDRRSLGRTDYDSFQARLEKRLSAGLQFLVSYTFSRQTEAVAYLNPQDGWDRLVQVPTATDAPHRLLVSTTYKLPFFENEKGFLAAVAGGWQVNAIVVVQSGLAVAIPANPGYNWTGADPTLPNATRDRWFNTCTETLAGARQRCASTSEPVVWKIQAPFTLRTIPTRMDDIRTSRPALVDFSMFKTFTLSGRVRLQVRGEAFNLLNTPWFGAPSMAVNNADFGVVAPTQANDPRNIQIGLRLSF